MATDVKSQRRTPEEEKKGIYLFNVGSAKTIGERLTSFQ